MSGGASGAGKGLPVLQPGDQVSCPMLRAGTLSAEICALRQHARAAGTLTGPRYYPCSYLIHGRSKKKLAIEYRCTVGEEVLGRLPEEWKPENWKPRFAPNRLVRRNADGRRRWILSHLPYDKINGRTV